MKTSKHKQLPANHSQEQVLPQYGSCKHISRKPLIKQQSHLPMSSNHTIQIKKQSKNQHVYESCSKKTNSKIKSSPYIHLPSLPTDQNNQNTDLSNVSNNYYHADLTNQKGSPGSIYDQFRFDQRHKRPFETEESQMSNYYGQQNNDYHRREGKKSQIQKYTQKKQSVQTQYSTKRQKQVQKINQSSSQSRCTHKSPNFSKKTHKNYQKEYQSVNHQMNRSQNRSPFHGIKHSQQMIKEHINQKIDRVCEKIQNLSRQKDIKPLNNNNLRQEDYRSQKGLNLNWNKKSYNNDTGQCYSSIVYSRNEQLGHSHKSVSKKNQYHQSHVSHNRRPHQIEEDNRIQHRILSPPKPTHQQSLQTRIIEMDKKIVFANAKILKLEEQLIQQREKLIKKQKQWLLRENQLLNWIQANQIQGQLVDHNKESPRRTDNPLKKTHIPIANNIIVNDKTTNQHHLKSQIQQYKQICNGLSQLITQITKVFKINHNWLSLLNRTLSHELPGTAFRVKEQMNLNHNFFIELQKLCHIKIDDLQKINSKSITTPKPSIGSDLSNPSLNTITSLESPFVNNPSLSQSEVFLLESYCPPVSQQFQIQTTKRNPPKIKESQKQRKSLSCLSESKSVRSINKKYPSSISTHKKSVKKQAKPGEPPKNNQKPNHSLYHSRKSQYYCDQVFYSRAKQINPQSPEQNQLKNSQQKVDNQLYYLLSLQALTIETLIPQQPSVQSTLDHDQEENLLSGMDS